uniref:Uncharacterized protein n=1 Tax=Noccaea caerulescens TaxID=107243 RepID=A0A1J3DKU7_NOCCA
MFYGGDLHVDQSPIILKIKSSPILPLLFFLSSFSSFEPTVTLLFCSDQRKFVGLMLPFFFLGENVRLCSLWETELRNRLIPRHIKLGSLIVS